MRLIGITGYKFHGKGVYAAAVEQEEEGFAVSRYKMAGPLKDAVRSIMHYGGFSRTRIEYHVEGGGKEEPLELWNGKTTRHAMQTLGTEWGRHCIGDNFWIDIMRSAHSANLNAGYRAMIIDDVRFLNEAQAIKDLGGILVRVERPGFAVDQSHSSEREVCLIDVDDVFFNTGTKEEADLAARLHYRTLLDRANGSASSGTRYEPR